MRINGLKERNPSPGYPIRKASALTTRPPNPRTLGINVLNFYTGRRFRSEVAL